MKQFAAEGYLKKFVMRKIFYTFYVIMTNKFSIYNIFF